MSHVIPLFALLYDEAAGPPPQSWYDDPYVGWAGDPLNPNRVTGHLVDGPGNYDIIHVTTLDPSGPGSFVEALQAPQNRAIVFDKGGICRGTHNQVNIYNPNYTVVGKTAPYPGFHVEDMFFANRAENCIWEHVGLCGQGLPDGVGGDGASIYNQQVRMIFNHCNFLWGADELCGVGTWNDGNPPWRGGVPGYFGYREYFWPHPNDGGNPSQWRANSSRYYTITNNIIAEGIDDSPKGVIVNDNSNHIAIVKNLFHSGWARQPRIDQGARVALVNNYVYNSSYQHLQMYLSHGSPGTGNNWEDPAVGAYINDAPTKIWQQGGVIQNGPTTVGYNGGIVYVARQNKLIVTPTPNPNIEIYIADYISKYANGNAQPQIHSNVTPYLVGSIPAEAYHNSIIPIPASQLRAYMIAKVGMRWWNRDPNSQRIINEMASDGSGGQTQVSANPVPRLEDSGAYPETTRVCNESDYDFDNLPVQKLTPYSGPLA